jgi:undecaprenyl-diphosphatase
MPDILKAIILGIVEGVTEFLPISSTGHLVLVEKLLDADLEGDPFWKMFTVFIQIGAIAAVVVYFWKRILDLFLPQRGARSQQPPRDGHALRMIIVGSLPLIIAYFANKWAEKNLESPFVIALALGIGGALMILIERFRPAARTDRIEAMNWRQALGIGLAQIVAAIFPGTSRSAATIMGGELAGLSRPAAAEFSFFLAIPAMGAACAFSLLKHRATMDSQRWLVLAVGTLVSFVVAWVVIAGFMAFIRRHSFIPFAIYRILLAIIVILVFRRS